jgi:hypothetical protein
VDENEVEPYDVRISQRGEYFAIFLTTVEICAGCQDDSKCGAYVGIGDLFAPTVVFIGDEDGFAIDIEVDADQYDACLNLLYTDAGRISECDFDPFEP